jgi:hypothetical protein
MAQKNNDELYARLILDELKSVSPSFDRLYNDVLETQTLTSSGSKVAATIRRCIFLPLRAKVHSRESVQTVARYADARPINARSVKGSSMVIAQMATMGTKHIQVTPTICSISVAWQGIKS